ncbi:MAG: hypothetical protein AAB538_03220 [Patescibacteria group bacterium]
MSRRLALTILLVVVAGSIALRVHPLTSRSIWFDEAFTWRITLFPVAEIISRTAADVHPPLYYLLLKAWTWVFGSSLLGLRSLSVAFAGVAVASAYLFAASSWRSRETGILAAAFTAVSAWQIPFAWDARMYTLVPALVLLSSWLLLRSCRLSLGRNPSARPLLSWAAYSVLAAMLVYVHNFGFLTLAAQMLFVVGMLFVRTRARLYEVVREPLARHAALAFLAAALMYLPWLPTLVQQVQRLQGNFWVPEFSATTAITTFYHFAAPTLEPVAKGWAYFALMLTLLAFLWLVVGESRSHAAAYFVATLTVVPIAFIIVISVMGQSLYHDRFLIFAHIFFGVALAALLTRFRSRGLAWTLGLCVLVLSLSAALAYQQELEIARRPGLQAAVVSLANQLQPEEKLYVSSPFIFLPAVFHAGHRAVPLPPLKLIADPKALPHYAGVAALVPDDVASWESVVASEDHSLWVIDTTGFGATPLVLPPPWERTREEKYQEVFPHQGEVMVSQWQRE